MRRKEKDKISHIVGLGEFEVVDTMHPRFNHYIDVMQHSSEKNFKLCNVKVTLLKKGTKK